MIQLNFGGAVVPAMAGFLFGNRAKVQEIQEVKSQQLPAVIGNKNVSTTGVALYLLSTPLVSGVAKYLKKQEKQAMTGVAKYVLRQTIENRNAPPVTGVTKYLANAAKQAPARKKTCIDKYLANQAQAEQNLSALTGVARYEAEQAFLVRKKAAAALAQRYREEEAEASLAKAAALAESQALSVANNEEAMVVEQIAATRVGRYLQEQAQHVKNTKPTGVSKYLAQQIIIDSQKPAISKVSRYLRSHKSATKKPNLTGVALYLSKQQSVPKVAPTPKVKLVQSGVARYLEEQATQAIKPSLTGVAKYMEAQAKLESSKTKLLVQLKETAAETSLEGEFIPAGDFIPASPTGVSRYLEKQGTVVSVVKERVTGVSRYIDSQAGSGKQSVAAPVSGVDRYLLKRA